MTEDFGPALDRELDNASPPTDITADGIIHKGRRQTFSRRARTGAAASIAAVMAAGLVFQLASGGGPGADAAGATPSGSASPEIVAQPVFPLPEVDPEKDWDWAWGFEGENEATKALTHSWWQALSGVDGAAITAGGEGAGSGDPAAEENFTPFSRNVDRLVEDLDPEPGGFSRGPEQGYTRPVYRLSNVPVTFDGVARPDYVSVTYFPRGSFLEGTKSIPGAGPHTYDWRHLMSGCEDNFYGAQGRDGWKSDYTCAESAGPAGERVIEIELAVHRPNDSSPAGRYSYAVVYLADGNAVVVQDVAPEAQLHGESEPSIANPRPGFSPAELAELVFSVPPVLVV